VCHGWRTDLRREGGWWWQVSSSAWLPTCDTWYLVLLGVWDTHTHRHQDSYLICVLFTPNAWGAASTLLSIYLYYTLLKLELGGWPDHGIWFSHRCYLSIYELVWVN
jgi:hypothetical protein